ncbi:CDP-glycerol glycerophosphotransferase family protein [Jeotgalibacillus proteolyticus]|uniref:CDP-glycerol glycerophosphotransferase family protein n=1 Tax=Jeotgalibacillus proteolyticus TaxID=2082395 RepID=UPI003CED6C11
METFTGKIARVTRRVIANKIKSARSGLWEKIRTQVYASAITLQESKLTIEGTVKFIRPINTRKHPVTMSLISTSSNKNELTEIIKINSSNHILIPGNTQKFSVVFDLNKLENKTFNQHKWTFLMNFSTNVTRKYKLYLPVKNIKEEVINYYGSYQENLLVPYRTTHGNLSVLSLGKEDLSLSRNLPNRVEEYKLQGNNLTIKGWVDAHYLRFFGINSADLKAGVKRRGSNHVHYFPLNFQNDRWESILNLDDVDFSKGIWDYYLFLDTSEEHLLFRMRIFEKEIFKEERDFFYSSSKESLRGIHYRSKQKGLSMVMKPCILSLSALKITNQDENVQIDAEFKRRFLYLAGNEDATEIELFIRQRDTNEGYYIPIRHSLTDDLYTIEGSFNYKNLYQEITHEKKIWDVYLDAKVGDGIRRFRIKTTSSNNFEVESRQSYEFRDSMYSMYFYPTIYKRLSIVYSLVPLKRNIIGYKFNGLNLTLRGLAYIEGEDRVDSIQLIAQNRLSEEEIYFPAAIKNDSIGTKMPKFSAEISLIELQSLIDSSKEIIDFYVQVTAGSFNRREKIGLRHYNYYKDDVLSSVSLPSKYEHININYCLTMTPRGNVKLETFKINENFMSVNSNSDNDDDIWLIGERPDTAQDTGYHFFRYCRLEHPNAKVYYAIEEGSHDLKNIKDLGNVLIAGSPEHFKIASMATALIGSHDFDYFLPFKGAQTENYKRAVKVFLQHGVLGRKMVEYNKKFYKYPFDIFCVSSTDEKNMVVEQLGYEDNDLKVTGLSRFDELIKDHDPQREILLIPTWREWLNTTDALMQSEYLKRYTSFLKNPELIKLLKRYNLTLNFYPHYRMQQFFDDFGVSFDDSIKFIRLGEKNVQDLLKENSLMITDYSSVSFDFSYLSKPVIYYHFDRDSFFKGGIMRPFEETFLGDVVHTEEELIECIKKSIEIGFHENAEANNKKHLIFDHIDQKNCERIWNEVEKEIQKKRSRN